MAAGRARQRSSFVCQSCSHRSGKWLGRCPQCGEWSSFAEELERVAETPAHKRAPSAIVQSLSGLKEDRAERYSCGLPLVDRVLGGGVVTGAATLLAGEPGIGKSTLLLQMGDALAEEAPVLYISAEESAQQLKIRAERLGCHRPDLLVAAETDLEPILEAVREHGPTTLLVDSIQAVRSAELTGPPGSIGQVRHCADRLTELAKEQQISLFLVGHITKEGAIAGPKSLEHLVDVVLTFEGEGASEYRILRAQKNRFGPTGEVAMFEMHDDGLAPIADPSRVLLAMRHGQKPGSAVLASVHGSRPLLVEVQALVHATSFPSPRRMAVGLDSNRVTLLVAVLERFGSTALADRDLFLNVVGGLALKEPAADLAVAAAIMSATREVALPEGCGFFGEVGLLGEVRPVARSGSRLRELAALGFKSALVPKLDRTVPPEGLKVTEVDDLEHLAWLLTQTRSS